MLVGVYKRGQRLGLEEPLVAELYDDARDRLKDTVALETFGVVAGNDSVGCDRSEQVEVFLCEPSTTWASGPIVDLLVSLNHRSENILGVLEELHSVFGFHLFEEHNTCILARRGGSRGVSYI